MTDKEYLLNTGTGTAIWTTELIQGELESIILISDDLVEVKIESELGYPVFEKNHAGTDCFIVRLPTHSPEGGVYNSHVDNIYLNEKLLIRIAGKADLDIKIIIRYK